MAQPTWSSGCLTLVQTRGKKKAFLPLYRAYVGQPDDHIGRATSMSFALIYPMK